LGERTGACEDEQRSSAGVAGSRLGKTEATLRKEIDELRVQLERERDNFQLRKADVLAEVGAQRSSNRDDSKQLVEVREELWRLQEQLDGVAAAAVARTNQLEEHVAGLRISTAAEEQVRRAEVEELRGHIGKVTALGALPEDQKPSNSSPADVADTAATETARVQSGASRDDRSNEEWTRLQECLRTHGAELRSELSSRLNVVSKNLRDEFGVHRDAVAASAAGLRGEISSSLETMEADLRRMRVADNQQAAVLARVRIVETQVQDLTVGASRWAEVLKMTETFARVSVASQKVQGQLVMMLSASARARPN